MIFARLGDENLLQMCGEVYDIVTSTTSIMLRKIYEANETINDTLID
jgi:hypothetical protein